MTKQTRNFWTEAALLAFIVAAIVTALVASELSPLNKDDVKLEVGDLRSFASAGSQLVGQHLAGETTQTFFDSQVSLIKSKVDSSAKTLRDAKVKPEVKNECLEAADMAEQVLSEFEGLSRPQLDLEAEGARMKNLATKLRDLEDRLK
jgi:hypothetical protein